MIEHGAGASAAPTGLYQRILMFLTQQGEAGPRGCFSWTAKAGREDERDRAVEARCNSERFCLGLVQETDNVDSGQKCSIQVRYFRSVQVGSEVLWRPMPRPEGHNRRRVSGVKAGDGSVRSVT